jgi:inorganic pyrophosphatase
MVDSGEGDDKIIAVPAKDPRFEDVKDLEDVNQHTLKTLKHFYESYKKLQNKEVTVSGFDNREAALAAVKKSIELYNEKFGK